MSTIPTAIIPPDREPNDQRLIYPTSDGRPMGETDLHRQDMFDLIESLKLFYRGQRVYVSGNILVFYQRGNRRKHISPDVMVVKGIDPHPRDNYLIWEQGKGPDVVIEVTSASTRDEDVTKKFELYRAVIKVPEYFLFDPRREFLNPPLQGYRLVGGQYVPIVPVNGRLPSEELGLHLEPNGVELRLWDSSTGQWIPTLHEAHEQAEKEAELARKQSEAAREQSERAQQQAEAARQQADLTRQIEERARRHAEAEIERLRREIETLRHSKNSP